MFRVAGVGPSAVGATGSQKTYVGAAGSRKLRVLLALPAYIAVVVVCTQRSRIRACYYCLQTT